MLRNFDDQSKAARGKQKAAATLQLILIRVW